MCVIIISAFVWVVGWDEVLKKIVTEISMISLYIENAQRLSEKKIPTINRTSISLCLKEQKEF